MKVITSEHIVENNYETLPSRGWNIYEVCDGDVFPTPTSVVVKEREGLGCDDSYVHGTKEVYYYAAARTLGWAVVPPTVYYDSAPEEDDVWVHIAMEYMRDEDGWGSEPEWRFDTNARKWTDVVDPDEMAQAVVIDWMFAQMDRYGKNLVFNEETHKLRLIDNAFARTGPDEREGEWYIALKDPSDPDLLKNRVQTHWGTTRPPAHVWERIEHYGQLAAARMPAIVDAITDEMPTYIDKTPPFILFSSREGGPTDDIVGAVSSSSARRRAAYAARHPSYTWSLEDVPELYAERMKLAKGTRLVPAGRCQCSSCRW